ncbi:MAG: glycoside hydrolase family 2 TIM barrel-domain containing protein [Candidatus Omnitrophota bacterium]|nr:glycoside hydrolase family 2 TIM barrel-domain containing protein [Candidatus Omnitrophota bacterium]
MKKFEIRNSKFETNAKVKILTLLFVVISPFALRPSPFVCFAQEAIPEQKVVAQETAVVEEIKPPEASAEELINKARDAKSANDLDGVFKYTQECIDRFKEEAAKEQLELGTAKQPSGTENVYRPLNDVAVSLFIQGEVYKEQGKKDEAKKVFNIIINEYPSSQAWDPRGWYYSLSEKSHESILNMERPQEPPPPRPQAAMKKTELKLHDLGSEEIINYEKYGKLTNVGTNDYEYVITDREGLSNAAGEGIYPNTNSVRFNPRFDIVKKEKRLNGSHWDFVSSPDLEAAFFKWAIAPEPPGVRIYYTAFILEKAGYIKQAIKAYYAILVHFPQSIGWTYWHTPWYVSQAAIAKIKHLIVKHPELGLKLTNARVRVINGFDKNINNDIFEVNPGKLEKISPWLKRLEEQKKRFLIWNDLRSVKNAKNFGKIKLIQYKNNHWKLFVNNKPYIIRGVTYSPTKVGQSPDNGTLTNWMDYDFNNNGKSDGPYDSFVDKNRNNQQDSDEMPVGDFRLMEEMGVNTIRVYHQPFSPNKELLRDLYKNYGIMVILGDFLGKYALGSGAKWSEGTDYANPVHKKNMMDSMLKMVAEFKDEPYILAWLLGNENVYGVACNADKDPESFFKFANEAALEIKKVDKEHPVAIASGDTLFLDIFGKNCPDIDMFGANAYRGDYGFVDFWQAVYDEADKPAFITEYGSPAYMITDTQEMAEKAQSEYYRSAWEDIMANSAGFEGYGNSLGGIAFEWLDEWWKAYEPSIHDTKRLWAGPFPEGFMYEEWLGIAGQGDGKSSPFLRQLRKIYYMYKEMWKKR